MCCSNSKLKPISHLNKSNDVAVCLFYSFYYTHAVQACMPHKTIFLVVILFHVFIPYFCVCSYLQRSFYNTFLPKRKKNRRKKDAFLHIIDSRNKQQITIPFTVWTRFLLLLLWQIQSYIIFRHRIMTEIWMFVQMYTHKKCNVEKRLSRENV